MGERASLTQARYRVLLRSLPADDATLDTLRELLRSAGLGDDEIARGFAHVPFVVAAGVTAERAREVAGALARAGGDVEIVSPPLGSPKRVSSSDRMARARSGDTQLGWYLLAGTLIVGLAAWFLVPSTTRLRLRVASGQTFQVRRILEVDQSIQRQFGLVNAKGAVRYDVLRTVTSVGPEEVQVVDRFRDPVFDLDVSGDGAANYLADLEKVKALMPSASVTRIFSTNGKLRESRDEDSLMALDPYPGYVDLMLGEMSFPPYAVKAGQSWESAIDLERAIQFDPEASETHLGFRTIPANLQTVKIGKGNVATSMFANAGNKLDLAGRVWFDSGSGVPVDLQVDLKRTRFAGATGVNAMDTIQVRLAQTLEK